MRFAVYYVLFSISVRDPSVAQTCFRPAEILGQADFEH